jgi:hypothetical protein
MFKKRFLYEEEEVELNDFQKIIAINKRKIHPSDVEFKTSDGEDFSDVISIDYDGIHFKFDRLSEFLKFFFPNEYGDDSDGGSSVGSEWCLNPWVLIVVCSWLG